MDKSVWIILLKFAASLSNLSSYTIAKKLSLFFLQLLQILIAKTNYDLHRRIVFHMQRVEISAELRAWSVIYEAPRGWTLGAEQKPLINTLNYNSHRAPKRASTNLLNGVKRRSIRSTGISSVRFLMVVDLRFSRYAGTLFLATFVLLGVLTNSLYQCVIQVISSAW